MRCLVTPVLVLWRGYLVLKGFLVDGNHLQGTPGTLPFWVAVAAVLGFAMWGNDRRLAVREPRFMWPLPTYLVAFLWFLLFTVAGWMMTELAGTDDRITSTVHYSLFGAVWPAFLIATISQFAINDANYCESINGVQNLLGGWPRWRRVHTCLLLAGGGALSAGS